MRRQQYIEIKTLVKPKFEETDNVLFKWFRERFISSQ